MAEILAPLYPSNIDFAEKMILSGADAFFMGIVSDNNKDAFTRRPQFKNTSDIGFSNANFLDKDNITSMVHLIHENRKKVFLAINEHYYSVGDYSYINEKLSEWGRLFDGFIISELSLIQEVLKNNSTAVASTGTHALNTESIKLLVELGFNAIVLPRAISKKQVAEFAQRFPEVKFEYFVFNDFCFYVDGLCRTLHGPPFLPVCIQGNAANPMSKYRIFGCRICNLFEMLKQDNVILKIAGRGHSAELIMKNVFVLNALRNSIGSFNTEKDFQIFAKEMYSKHLGNGCQINCKKDD